MNNKTKGFLKEKIVADFLLEKGWTIIAKNKKILEVEVDILAEKNKQKTLVEVKSIKNEDQIENRLKQKQKERLKKVAESLCEDSSVSVQLFLATVDSQNKINFFEII